MRKRNDWHFARPALAKHYLALFENGLTSARGLFARRRMGKTEFLKKDFIPAAKAKGYLVVYTNLWDLEIDPATALVSEFYKGIEPKGFEKIWERLKLPVSKIRAAGRIHGIIEGSVEANVGKSKKVVGTLLMEAMQAFDKTKYEMILVIDEAQVLAYSENAHFSHSLRAALDIRKDRIKVIFAGSSEATLRRMFSTPSEPFYNWSPLESFELLGKEFVKSMVERVNKICKYPLKFEYALKAFAQLKKTPEFFRQYIECYLINPSEGANVALRITKSKIFSDENFKQQWNNLLPADKVILSMIARRETDLHGKAILEKIALSLGIEGVSKNTTHNALRRLTSKNIITKIQYGLYQFEDEAFCDWVKHLD